MGWLWIAGYIVMFLVTIRFATRYYLTKTDLPTGKGDKGLFGFTVILTAAVWPLSWLVWGILTLLVWPVWNAPDRVRR